MIEIIKHGVPKTDIVYRFKCGRCGCEWIADSKDYTSYSGGMGHEWVSCHCPECDNVESRDTAEQTRNLNDEETAIYDNWLEYEAKDTGINITGCEQNV